MGDAISKPTKKFEGVKNLIVTFLVVGHDRPR